MKQSAPFIYILNDWYNYGYVASILTTRVMLSVSEASEKEILHCVQNDKAVRKASLRSRRMTKR